jgi:photosystem II stability/assembly factor-like uncharacterized protein
MYCQTDVGGAYKWNAADTSWIPVTDFFTASQWNFYGIESIAIDPENPDNVYMAVGMYSGAHSSWDGNGAMYRSNDNGKTWKGTALSFQNGGNDDGRLAGERLSVDPNKGNILFYGSRVNGMWKSIDSSKTWQKNSSFPVTSTKDYVGIAFVIFDKTTSTPGNATKVIYAGVSRKGSTNMYVSSDSGTTWQAIPGQSTNLMPNHAVLSSDSILYISYGDSCGPNSISQGAIRKFDTRNQTWSTLLASSTGNGGFGGIAIDAANPKVLMACTIDRWNTQDEVYRSVDGGATWNSLKSKAIYDPWGFKWWTSNLVPHWLGDIEIDPFNSNHVLFTTGFGIFSSFDATNADGNTSTHWLFTDRGLEETVPQEIVSPSYGAHLLSVIGDFDGFRHNSLDSSAKRFAPNIGTTNHIAYAYNEPSIVARVGSVGQYSKDGGNTWAQFSKAPASGSTGGNIAISADSKIIVWSPSGTSATYYTANFGLSWATCANAPSQSQVVADAVNPLKFYAYNGSAIYISTDGGASFSKSGSVAGSGKIRVTPGIEGDIWVPGSGGLFHSVNSGTSFSRISSVASAGQMGLGKSSPGTTYPTIYLSGTINGNIGFYRSIDTAKTWVRIDDPQHQFGGCNAIIGDNRVFGRVYIATGGRGVIYGMPVFDCHNDSLGSAFIDQCDSCVGGNTGKLACSIDCHGDLNGTATVDNCGICSGGNTGITACTADCKGVYGGSAYLDTCGICVGGTTNKLPCTSSSVKTLNSSYFSYDPNPFSETLNLQTSKPVSYKILNIAGIIVENGTCLHSIKIGEKLNDGIYLMVLNNNKEITTVKIVKSQE